MWPIQLAFHCLLPKNPTTALRMLTPLYSHYTRLHVLAHKGMYPGITDIFCENGQKIPVQMQLKLSRNT